MGSFSEASDPAAADIAKSLVLQHLMSDSQIVCKPRNEHGHGAVPALLQGCTRANPSILLPLHRTAQCVACDERAKCSLGGQRRGRGKRSLACSVALLAVPGVSGILSGTAPAQASKKSSLDCAICCARQSIGLVRGEACPPAVLQNGTTIRILVRKCFAAVDLQGRAKYCVLRGRSAVRLSLALTGSSTNQIAGQSCSTSDPNRDLTRGSPSHCGTPLPL